MTLLGLARCELCTEARKKVRAGKPGIESWQYHVQYSTIQRCNDNVVRIVCRLTWVRTSKTNENSHTAVLDLGMAEESDSGLVALAPDGGAGEVKGVVVLEYRIGLFSESLEVGLCFNEGNEK